MALAQRAAYAARSPALPQQGHAWAVDGQGGGRVLRSNAGASNGSAGPGESTSGVTVLRRRFSFSLGPGYFIRRHFNWPTAAGKLRRHYINDAAYSGTLNRPRQLLVVQVRT